MPRSSHQDILDLFGALGWRPGNDTEDLIRMRAAAQPTTITAAAILARVANGNQLDDDDSSDIRPYRNPLADGLARAARNGGDIPEHIEERMRADRARAKRAKRLRP